MRNKVEGYVNEHQLKRASDGYDGGVVRLNVYDPDHEDGDASYDKKATIIVGEEKLWTETELKKLIGILIEHLESGRSIGRGDIRAWAKHYVKISI